MKHLILHLITERAMNDRPILSPESVREVSNIVLDAVQIYADKFGFEVESCAVEIDPKYKVRILEGEKTG